MRARGAAVTGLGAVGAFGALQTIPGTGNCSFGDIAIAPTGAVVQACQTPTGGQGPGDDPASTPTPTGSAPRNFGAARRGDHHQRRRLRLHPGPERRGRWTRRPAWPTTALPASPHFGRLYLVYTEETVDENHDTGHHGALLGQRRRDLERRRSASTTIPRRRSAASSCPRSRATGCPATSRSAGTTRATRRPTPPCRSSAPSRRRPAAAPTFMANGQIGDALTSGNGSNRRRRPGEHRVRRLLRPDLLPGRGASDLGRHVQQHRRQPQRHDALRRLHRPGERRRGDAEDPRPGPDRVG